MRAPRLYNLDTVMIDVSMRVDSVPRPGADAHAEEYLVAVGGGFNVMSAATRHGMAAVYVGQLGSGPFADIAKSSLRREDIKCPVVVDPLADVGFCLVLVDSRGERTFVTASGAEVSLRRIDLEGLDLRGGDYVFLSGYNVLYPHIGATVTAWLEELRSDVIVAFDPGPRVTDIEPTALHRVLARTDWLLCNGEESLALSGEGTVDRAVDALVAMTGRRGVVVHDGAAGCVVATPHQRAMRVRGFPAEVIDTNGAGDAHDGVFLAETARGTELFESARRANAAAAMAIGRLGPATSPRRDEVSAWLGATAT